MSTAIRGRGASSICLRGRTARAGDTASVTRCPMAAAGGLPSRGKAEFLASNLGIAGFTPETAVFQVVKELVENAVDAGATAVRVDVEQLSQSVSVASGTAGAAPGKRKRQDWAASASGGEVPVCRVCVTDNGRGMAAAAIPQLGSVFATSKAGAGAASASSHAGGTSFGRFGIGLKAATLYAQQHRQPPGAGAAMEAVIAAITGAHADTAAGGSMDAGAAEAAMVSGDDSRPATAARGLLINRGRTSMPADALADTGAALPLQACPLMLATTQSGDATTHCCRVGVGTGDDDGSVVTGVQAYHKLNVSGSGTIVALHIAGRLAGVPSAAVRSYLARLRLLRPALQVELVMQQVAVELAAPASEISATADAAEARLGVEGSSSAGGGAGDDRDAEQLLRRIARAAGVVPACTAVASASAAPAELDAVPGAGLAAASEAHPLIRCYAVLSPVTERLLPRKRATAAPISSFAPQRSAAPAAAAGSVRASDTAVDAPPSTDGPRTTDEAIRHWSGAAERRNNRQAAVHILRFVDGVPLMGAAESCAITCAVVGAVQWHDIGVDIAQPAKTARTSSAITNLLAAYPPVPAAAVVPVTVQAVAPALPRAVAVQADAGSYVDPGSFLLARSASEEVEIVPFACLRLVIDVVTPAGGPPVPFADITKTHLAASYALTRSVADAVQTALSHLKMNLDGLLHSKRDIQERMLRGAYLPTIIAELASIVRLSCGLPADPTADDDDIDNDGASMGHRGSGQTPSASKPTSRWARRAVAAAGAASLAELPARLLSQITTIVDDAVAIATAAGAGILASHAEAVSDDDDGGDAAQRTVAADVDDADAIHATPALGIRSTGPDDAACCGEGELDEDSVFEQADADLARLAQQVGRTLTVEQAAALRGSARGTKAARYAASTDYQPPTAAVHVSNIDDSAAFDVVLEATGGHAAVADDAFAVFDAMHGIAAARDACAQQPRARMQAAGAGAAFAVAGVDGDGNEGDAFDFSFAAVVAHGSTFVATGAGSLRKRKQVRSREMVELVTDDDAFDALLAVPAPPARSSARSSTAGVSDAQSTRSIRSAQQPKAAAGSRPSKAAVVPVDDLHEDDSIFEAIGPRASNGATAYRSGARRLLRASSGGAAAFDVTTADGHSHRWSDQARARRGCPVESYDDGDAAAAAGSGWGGEASAPRSEEAGGEGEELAVSGWGGEL